MTHPYSPLQLDNGAKLLFTPCPGTKDASLTDAVLTLRDAGTQTVLTLMFDEEMANNQAQTLPSVCRQHDINWIQLPILDNAAPGEPFERQWRTHRQHIIHVIEQRGVIAVHCKGGAGRTGLVIGLVLLACGWPADKVIAAVQHIRPNALKNPAQLDYFKSYF